MLRNKKGFTLVELLAVIVILAIILAIAVPTISSIIKSQRKSAFETGVKMLIRGIDYQILQGTTVYDNAATTNVVLSPAEKQALGANATDYATVTVTAKTPVTITVSGGGKYGNCAITSSTFTTLGTVSGSDCV